MLWKKKPALSFVDHPALKQIVLWSHKSLSTCCLQTVQCSSPSIAVSLLHISKYNEKSVNFQRWLFYAPSPVINRENAIVERLLSRSVNFQSEIWKHHKIKDMYSCSDKRHPFLHSLAVNSCLLTHCSWCALLTLPEGHSVIISVISESTVPK